MIAYLDEHCQSFLLSFIIILYSKLYKIFNKCIKIWFLIQFFYIRLGKFIKCIKNFINRIVNIYRMSKYKYPYLFYLQTYVCNV